VPLSISSSNRIIRTRSWGKLWLVAVMTAVAVLGAWEGFWRWNGFVPSVEDDWDVWAAARRSVSRKSGRSIVLIGSSRIQLGLHPDVIERRTGIRPVMLAIDGSSPLPVLSDLADDPEFSGTVICSLLPLWLAETSPDTGRSEKWIRKYRKQVWSGQLETRLSTACRQMFVFRYPGLSPARVWSHVREGTRPRMPYAPMRPDRYRPADFTVADIQQIRASREQREKARHAAAEPMPPDAFMKRVEAIRASVRRIRGRGGQVVFVRLPSTGVIRQLEQRTWPRHRYWDIFANHVQAVTVHFEDVPALAGFPCPDGSHLDVRDAVRFTDRLVKTLIEKKLDL